MASAADNGRSLEQIIHTASLQIPDLTRSLREYDIRTHFGDASLNGVDHWITVGSSHILIQDKWKETSNQQEVSQFLTCAERIHSRLPTEDKVFLIWACKKEPTANCVATLQERGSGIVTCGVSLEGLARCVLIQICECLNINSTQCLQAIPSISLLQPLGTAKRKIESAIQISGFDENEDGKKSIEEMKQFIGKIHQTCFRKIEMAMNTDAIPEVYALYSGTMPKSPEDWYNGKISKIDFTGFLKTIKTICWPTNKKKLNSRNLFFYTKLRKISTEFATLANEYDAKRKALIGNKSVWGKNLPALKANAEPITEAEFKGALENCEDYWMNIWKTGPASEIKKIPNYGLLNAFHSQQCNVY
jgi:hypothetical protein